MKIAIQGFKGSYHEIAAYKYFGEREPIDFIECASFPIMFETMKNDSETMGVLAIENTVAGTILPNYLQLQDSNLDITGEVYLRIEHCLMALPEATIDSLTEVRSHPMALLQCLEYFKQHPHISLVESPDTALSAIQLKESKNKHIGVIASHLAAENNQLNILESGIETNPRNFTRFLILRTPNKSNVQFQAEDYNKVSLNFNLQHAKGSLAKVLTILAEFEIDLTKIQSIPVIGKEFEYSFITDINFKDQQTFLAAIKALTPYTTELRVLGKYKAGRKYRKI